MGRGRSRARSRSRSSSRSGSFFGGSSDSERTRILQQYAGAVRPIHHSSGGGGGGDVSSAFDYSQHCEILIRSVIKSLMEFGDRDDDVAEICRESFRKDVRKYCDMELVVDEFRKKYDSTIT